MSERWKRIERLYHAALERETATREAFLAEACADDEELRREIVSLIAYDGRPASLIESPVLEVAAREWADESSSLLSHPSANAPSQIGAYKILSPLGRGGMGEVWLAYDTRLGRKAAIKLLPVEFTGRPERVRRFEQEARAASALNHPNIVTIYEIGEIDDRRFIVTEYVEGETLRQRTAKAPQQRIRLSEALEVASQVAAALQAAHEAGITHRDIKPENVMARKDGLVKVLDFGLAKLRVDRGTERGRDGGTEGQYDSSHSLRPSISPSLTAAGAVMGTTSYMSPEQARGEKVDHRTDIFSLGVMLYEMLAGRRPFEGATASDVMAAILTGEPISLMEIAPQTTAHLWRIARRCLEKEPERRFQSAGDLAFALEELKASSDFSPGVKAATSAQTPAQVATPILNRLGKGWRPWVLATAATTVMLAAVVVAVFQLRKLPEEKLAVSFTFSLPNNLEFRGGDAPAVSPDGKYIVYAANLIALQSRNESSLWLRRLDSAEAKPLPGTEGGYAPFWSPDSRFVAFWANGLLRKIDILGGPATTICEDGAALPGDWSRDGAILFPTFSTLKHVSLKRVSAIGGQSVELKPFAEGETQQFNPRFLPDGQHFLYFSRNSDEQKDGIYVASLDPGAQRKLVLKGAVFAIYIPTGHLLFAKGNLLMAHRFDLDRLEVAGEPVRVAEQVANHPDDLYAYLLSTSFSASENGVLAWKVQPSEPNKTQLTWFDRSGKRLGTVGDPAMYSGPSFSPGEDRLAVAIADPKTRMRDLWIMRPLLGDISRLTFSPGDDLNPRWTPDGKWIIFTSTQNGPRNIYRKLADGKGEVESLLTSEESLHVEDISPDGRFLVFNYYPDQKEPRLALLSLRGERKRIPFPTTQFREESGRFSPNGRWIAYRSMEKGESKIFVRAFPLVGGDAGSKWQISDRSGNQPQWRGDGKELFFLENSTLMAVEVNTEGSSFSSGTPKPLFSVNIEDEQRRNRYIATKDGQRFLVVMRAPTAIENTVAVQVNWPAALKQ